MYKIDKSVIALTGATGFLGSHLLVALISKGYNVVVLGRSLKEESLSDRINRLLKWFGCYDLTSRVICIEADLSKELLGIEKEKYYDLCSDVDTVIHCASDTSFSESRRDKVLAANIDNLKAILQFSADANVKLFHYISTAYVAGAEEKYCREILSAAKKFTNVYEESKAGAEYIISQFCQKNSINLSIIRPSIVYGDSKTGRSLKFNALYFPVRSAQTIRDIYLNDIKNNAGKKASKSGIYLDEEGYLFVPLRIYLPDEGYINIIPVDYFTEAAMRIIENCPQGGIFNLTNNSPTTMNIVSKYFEDLMKVRGVEIKYGQPPAGIDRNPAEELFDRFIEPYRPYLSDSRVFERTNADLATGNLHPPEFTFDIFRTCMNYAIRVNWGQLIFSDSEIP